MANSKDSPVQLDGSKPGVNGGCACSNRTKHYRRPLLPNRFTLAFKPIARSLLLVLALLSVAACTPAEERADDPKTAIIRACFQSILDGLEKSPGTPDTSRIRDLLGV